MNSLQHTPGPWQWDGNCRINAVQFYKPSPYTLLDGEEKVYMHGLVALPYSCAGENYEANANLIAAAPCLLAALDQLVECVVDRAPLDFLECAIKAAEIAIAKATGETA